MLEAHADQWSTLKHFTVVNYDFRVIMTSKLPKVQLSDS